MNVGTDESFLKLKYSQEIINNGEKYGWLKQRRAADEKYDSNKWWPNIASYIGYEMIFLTTAT